MVHPSGTEVKVRNLKNLRTGGMIGRVASWEPIVEKYKIDFQNGFVGWYKREQLWIASPKGKWELHS